MAPQRKHSIGEQPNLKLLGIGALIFITMCFLLVRSLMSEEDTDHIKPYERIVSNYRRADERNGDASAFYANPTFYPAAVPYVEDAVYPKYSTLLNVLEAWEPDTPDPPPSFRETLQHFDYQNATERKWAEEYRNAEIPFKVYNIPEFDSVTDKWTKGIVLLFS